MLEAIQFARKIYAGVHKSPVDSATVYVMMGFNGKNGSSATALGAVRQFGLVDGLRGELRISELGMKIFEPSSFDEYADALQTAANSPDAFREIRNQFGGEIPKIDEPIRSFLIRSRDFSKAGADDCIKSLRQTLSEVESVILPSKEKENFHSIDNSILSNLTNISYNHLNSNFSLQDANYHTIENVRFMLTKSCSVTLSFTGLVTPNALDRLKQHIELMRYAFDE
ncbi:hypothetical protein [Polymorphobacter sp.]|uniref:hypothetical protein n=1 Tax=Polymorphobacter sp. TaxID=1909290 RepID=UPI003F72D2AA